MEARSIRARLEDLKLWTACCKAPGSYQLVVIKTVCRMKIRGLKRYIIGTVHTIISNIPPNASCEGGRNVDNEHCSAFTA